MLRALTSFFCTTLPLATLGCLISLTAKAQIAADGTTLTTVNQNGNNFTIEQGDRLGDNLFHSFNEFSVPTLGSASFNNPTDIVNIFSRITGNNISDIDGLISANGAANLFLINPNGIIFGENASLNFGGSFFASTADSLLFEDNIEFSATNPTAPPLLTINMPMGLNFGNNPGEIVNRSVVKNSAGDSVGLEVAPGKNLTLVGGDINFETGNTTARGGNIQLGGLSAAGIVGINEDGSLNFAEDLAQADITLSNAADVDVFGTGDGSITINARNLNLEAGNLGRSFIRGGITADSTSAAAQAGDITINATDNVSVDNSLIVNQVLSEAEGNSGDVNISTDSLTLTNGAVIGAVTDGRGNAGAIVINATDTMALDGTNPQGDRISRIASQVNPTGIGDAKGIEINTANLFL
ncbi:MAG: filamentous hemagglutinin N-terminal domain-containing protein, partial [Pleurocapsa sp. MO_192.B19]|nr:filamentous hemagglutinin N-terminal domain-containing protein [Pleurocapsa sp. MO_192.B19]